MDEKELKLKFKEYLSQKGENTKKLDETTKRFGNNILNVFFNGLESYRQDSNRSYKQVFWEVVLPQMKNKINSFGDYYFKDGTYEKYEGLFVKFMMFAKENRDYINSLMFDKRKEKLENSVEGQYGRIFNKKAFLEVWHNYIKEDKGKNGDKFREYLADIYGYLDVEGLKILYEIFFDSYEICSKVTSKNNEHRGKENYKKRDAFDEAFSNLESKLPGFNGEKLSEVKSLFGKYLNFIPKYRDILFNVLDGETGVGKDVQKNTELSLFDNLSDDLDEIKIEDQKKDDKQDSGNEILLKQANTQNTGIEGDGFGPIKVVNSSRDSKNGIFDQTERGDIIAPIDYGIFDDEENND